MRAGNDVQGKSDVQPRAKGLGFFLLVVVAFKERKAPMISRYQGVAGAAVVALAAFLLGMSINSSSSSETNARVQSTPAPATPLDLSQLVLPTLQPQLVQVEITVKQEPASPQVIEVMSLQAAGPNLPLPQVAAVRPTATPRPPPPTATATPVPAPPRPPVAPQPIVTVVSPQPTPAALAAGAARGAAAPTATPVPTSTPNPCLNRVCAGASINFAGSGSSHANVQASCNVSAGSVAWECIKQAFGVLNIQFKDFGGSLGIFVSGLYGIAPDFGACNCFWEFTVNGASSDLGVSGYIVRSGDTLGFRIGH
jgi:uncharacterized protein DUF4430